MNQETAEYVARIQGLFQTIGHAFAGDKRCPFVIGCEVSHFIPKGSMVLSPDLADKTHQFVFYIKLKTQIEKEMKEQTDTEKASLIV